MLKPTKHTLPMTVRFLKRDNPRAEDHGDFEIESIAVGQQAPIAYADLSEEMKAAIVVAVGLRDDERDVDDDADARARAIAKALEQFESMEKVRL